jgi:hypothetical protein
MKTIRLLLFALLFTSILSCDKKDDPKPDATNVTITGIKIVTMPLTDAGSDWDLDGGADPFFTIINSTTTLYSHPNYYQDVVSGNFPLSYTIASGYKLPSINQVYGINLYDYDATSGNDYIGQVGFNPNSYKSERPSSKTFTDGNVQITINFSWE